MLLTYVNKVFLVVVISIIKVYQVIIGPYLPVCCKFSPSCSEYAITSFVRHGLLRGAWLTASRLLKCQAFYKKTEERRIDE